MSSYEPPRGTFRVVRAYLLFAAVASSALPAFAASPASGTLSTAAPQLDFTGGPFNFENQSDALGDGSFLACSPFTPCDDYDLHVDLPADYTTTHPQAMVRVFVTTDADSDYDIYVVNGDGSYKAIGWDEGPTQEVTFAAGAGIQDYTVRIVPFVGGAAYSATIELQPGTPAGDADGDGVPDGSDLCPLTPPGTTVDATGCPITSGDEDSDGVPDGSDLCPDTPAGQAVDAAGCPVVSGNAETCDVPGLQLLSDPADDNTGGPTGPAPGPAGTDLLSLQISQPAQDPVGDSIDNQLLVFQINIEPGATPSPATVWFTSFRNPGGTLQGVRMSGDSNGNPVFESYFVGADNSGGTDGRFAAGTSPAHGASTFDAATGAITIWVRATAIGFTSPGEKLKDFNAGVMQQGGGVLAFNATDGMPANDLSRSATAEYTLHDNTVCGGPALKPPQPPAPASGLPPRFYDLQSPAGVADSAGEPTVGYNPATNAAMFIAGTEVDRITFAEHSAARDAAGNVLPESCPAQWQDASYAGAVNTLDPILETYQPEGRTFQSSLSGANSIFAYSDDDGANWTPGQAGPPNGGADHQTLGVGPWADGAKPASATEDYAIFYCSQSVVAAFCSRSDDGGTTFGPGIPFRNSLTDCDNAIGGLHGHVQVARNDGTVYVPFGNCNDKAAVGVSLDSGTTWEVKKVTTSVSGDDPGLGIADDGTAYLCYAAGDKGKPFAVVSQDQGDSWTPAADLGAALGLRHAVFTTAVAGDGERAACAFLATTMDGDAGAADFPGVWYAYVATTYDRGVSWHVVKASEDPVQGAGGICTDGTTCGDNRNLLDFNDVIKTEQGRILFGYADGCRGACVKDPGNVAKNGLAANGVMARQSGGRTLVAAFDDDAGTQFNSDNPIAPAAACAQADRSTRTATQATIQWNAGDTGGSAITNYKVYRGLAATGPWVLLGSSGTATKFVDSTVLDTVEKYYYKVVAENAIGAALDSNVIELPISLTPPETSCEVPGITVALESAPGDCGAGSGGCTGPTDIQRIQIAEPPDQPDSVVLTIKVADLNPAPAPGTYWFFLTKTVKGENLYFGMDTSQATPRYTYGTYAVSTLTSFTEEGTITGAFETDGHIHLYAPKSLFGTPTLAVGDSIIGIEARTRVGASAGTSRDAISGDDYTLVGIEGCIDPPVVLASLAADVLQGQAPFDVTFTISGDPSKGKDLDTFSLTFGDEQGSNPPAYAGSFAGQDSVQVTHRYLNAGAFAARLTVKDTGGFTSTNVAEKVINATAPDVLPKVAPDSNNHVGGFGALTLFVLGLAGLGRARRGARSRT
jgi:hypothetical protein